MTTQQWVPLYYYRGTQYFVKLSTICMCLILLVTFPEVLSDFQQIWDFSKTKRQENSSNGSPAHTYGRMD